MNAEEVKDRYEKELLRIPGVVGVLSEDGELVVLVESEDVELPRSIEGIPIRKEVVGKVRGW